MYWAYSEGTDGGSKSGSPGIPGALGRLSSMVGPSRRNGRSGGASVMSSGRSDHSNWRGCKFLAYWVKNAPMTAPVNASGSADSASSSSSSASDFARSVVTASMCSGASIRGRGARAGSRVTGAGTAGLSISVSAGEIMSEQSARDSVTDRIVVEAFFRRGAPDRTRGDSGTLMETSLSIKPRSANKIAEASAFHVDGPGAPRDRAESAGDARRAPLAGCRSSLRSCRASWSCRRRRS